MGQIGPKWDKSGYFWANLTHFGFKSSHPASLTMNGKYQGKGTPNSPGNTTSTYQATRQCKTESIINMTRTVAMEKLSSTETPDDKVDIWMPDPDRLENKFIH